MYKYPALGQVYLDSPSSIDSYLPEFVLQSDVFNKQVKNILIKISDIQTSTTNTIPNQIHQQPLSFNSIHQQINYLRKITNQKNQEIQYLRKEIQESQQIRINDCNLIEQLQNRIKVFHQEKHEQISQHLAEKQNLLNRINRIQEEIDSISYKNKDQRIYELEIEIEILRSRLQDDNKQGISSIDPFKVQQMGQQIFDLKQLNNNLVIQNGELKFQLQMLVNGNNQIQTFKNKVIQQERELNKYKFVKQQYEQYKQKMLLKENEIAYSTNLIQSLNKQILSLKQKQRHSLTQYNNYNQQQIQYLNREIQELKRQNQQITKKQNDVYEQKVKYERQCYKLTSNLHQLVLTKEDLETKKFELDISKKQILRIQNELNVEMRTKNQLLYSKQYIEEELLKKEGERQGMMIKLQNLEKESMRNQILESENSAMSAELNQIHQKYIDANTKLSQIVLKYQMMMKQNENLKGIINSSKIQFANLETKCQHKQQQYHKINQSHIQLSYQNKQLETECSRLQNQLKYNDSKLLKFQQTVIEFQKSYEQLEFQLQEIKSSIIELQQLQNIFLHKQPHFIELISSNLNRLIKYRENIKPQHNYKLQKRTTLFNQLIQIIQSQNTQINESRHFIRTIEDNLQKYSFQIEKNKLSLNTLMFEKEHLFHELNSVLEKLRYVENHLERQNRVGEIQVEEIEQLKKMNKSLNQRLGEEMQKKVWLENRLSGNVDVDIEGLKMERSETMRRMKGMFENE